jgi:hypothetical protein
MRINCGFFVPQMCVRASPVGLMRVSCGGGPQDRLRANRGVPSFVAEGGTHQSA